MGSNYEPSNKHLKKSLSSAKFAGLTARSRSSYSYSSNTKQLPSKNTIENEKLLLENFKLKDKLKDATDEIARLKAKTKLLKHDLAKANAAIGELNGHSNSAQLVVKLKKLVHSLKLEVNSQRTEIESLKKKMRVTQHIELEAEKQVYVGECIRLRQLLNEAAKPLPAYKDAADKAAIQSDALVAELSRFKLSPRDKQVKKSNESSLSPVKAFGKAGNLEEDVKILQTYDVPANSQGNDEGVSSLAITRERPSFIERLSMVPEAPLSGPLMTSFNKKLRTVQKNLSAVLCIYNANDPLSAEDLFEQLHCNGVDISLKEVADLWKAKFRDPKVKAQTVIDTLGKGHSRASEMPTLAFETTSRERTRDFSDFSIQLKTVDSQQDSSQTLFQHLAMRMQLHRVTSEQAVQILADAANASRSTQQALLAEEPFDFTDEDERKQMAKILSGGYSTEELTKQLGTWRVLEDAEEERFDKALSTMMKEVKAKLIAVCARYDRASTGKISFTEFLAASKDCGLEYEPRLKLYIKLLSYSFEHKLDSAPYGSLVEAFTKTDDEVSVDLPEISDKEQEEIVTKLLKGIALGLRSSGNLLERAFKAKKGLISADGLLEGLNTLLNKQVQRKEFLVMLATLQSERYEGPVIELRTLEAFVKEAADALPTEHLEKGPLNESQDDLQEDEESYVIHTIADPVRFSSRAMRETQEFSPDSEPKSY